MIEFRDVKGVTIGFVVARNDVLLSDVTVESVAASWLRAGGDVDTFEDTYDGWANGYATGSRVNDDPVVVSRLTAAQVSETVLE